MGNQFNFQRLEASNAADAKQEGGELIDKAKFEKGHGGYSGSWAECTGVVVRREVLALTPENRTALLAMRGGGQQVATREPTESDVAESWLEEHAEKWGRMLVVQAGAHFYAGAWCSS